MGYKMNTIKGRVSGPECASFAATTLFFLAFHVNLFADSLVKMTAKSRTVLKNTLSAAPAAPPDKPGASWTDKVMAVKMQSASQDAPLPQDDVEGVADEEWVSSLCADNSMLYARYMHKVITSVINQQVCLHQNYKQLRSVNYEDDM